MAKTQSRRSVSIKGTTHERVKRLLARMAGESNEPEPLCHYVERLLILQCDKALEPQVSPDEVVKYPTVRTKPRKPAPIPSRRKHPGVRADIKANFTF